MKSWVPYILGLIFIALLVGLFFTTTDAPFPTTTQVYSPDASTLAFAGEQGTMLAVLAIATVLLIGMMTVALLGVVWLLNRQVAQVQQEPNQPLKMLEFSRTEKGTITATEALADNALWLIAGAGVAMLLVVIALLVLL